MPIIDTIYIAIVAVVFSCILIDEEMICGWYGKLIKKLPDYLSHPLGECAYCFGGQIALWRFFFYDGYNIYNHIIFVSLTIFIIHITLFVYERTS